VNSNAIKTIKGASKAYEALAEAYEELDNMPKLKAQVKSDQDNWAEVCQ
jgi:COP9 signalosome complex subunit 3